MKALKIIEGWKLVRANAAIHVAAGNLPVCKIISESLQCEANAKLIAAAPDLGEYARCEYEFATNEEFTTGGKSYYQHYAVAKLREMRLEALLKAGYAENKTKAKDYDMGNLVKGQLGEVIKNK